ncbi:hypothetical protein DICSQDRAFT_181332 [Dichomitus squalens LYAD-421 SS1]|uniref:Zn(2)-C6 fungal-type domain-containing protein n=1 Tax=Dichomitus squalens (strain LYAD-421) TaxID=732165 RepID=R7SZL3_DICSQ|nr:uncharacterized protein DICSQDRAFT_181332 [Dichomitus squalens LYAD-421 SS1]EJF60412.1 hypothetical protein DICSQDRAFT_181332 [Dichomitus squalens LYAD-421 SS1]
MSSEDEEVARPQYKRQKHTRACEFCRRRKVGCKFPLFSLLNGRTLANKILLGDAADKPDNRCSRCIAHGIQCQYDPAAKMKRPTKNHRYVEALEDRLSKVEDLLKKLHPEASASPESLEDAPQRMPCSSFRRATHPTLPASVLFPRGFHPTTGTDSSDDIDPSDDDGHAVTDVNFKGYHGKSSGSDLRPLQDITKPFTPNTLALASNIFPAYKENVYPPRDLMHELIDAYFNRLNIYLALLHRPTFERDVKNGLHLRDRGFGAVLLLVCAIGSGLLLDSSQIQSHGPPPGYHWFELVSTTDFSLLARPRLYDLQACALIAAYINMASSPQGCGVMLSLGIRMAQDVGAHRKKMYSATPTPEQELWKRAFWVLVAMDRIASFALGRPSTINDEDFDLDPMTECDDEYWSHPDPSQAFKQPPGKPSKVAFCNAFIRLLKIQASASRTIFTLNKSKLLLGYVGPEWKQRIVAELDSSMNKWLYTVPPHLRWDPNREDILFFYQSAILYTSYYQLQICIHRPFIPSPRRRVDNPPLPSMTICVNAARACVRVLHAQHKRMMAASGITSYTFTPFEMPLFTVGTMLGVYLWCGARDAQATLEDMDICFNILKDFEEHSVGARKLRAVLEVMVPSASRSPGEGPPSASRTIFTLNKSKLLLGYVGPEWKQRIVAELDSSMNKWLYTVPPHLRWDPNREDILFFYQSAILYTSYYQLQICIHRPFIPSPRRRVDNPPLPSMTICVNAARACVRVLHAQHKRMMAASGITSYTFTPFEMPLFTVGTMLGVYLWCGARDAQATLEDMDICFNILKDFEEHSVGARKLRAVLEVMVPSASRSPGEGPRTAPGSNLAKEGAQTIDEILTVAMKSLRISPHTTSSSDSSGTPSTPASADPALSSEMNTLRSNSCSDPTGINPEQAASLNELAYNLFSGCDMWALESNTINTPFTQDRLPSPFFSAGTDGDGTGPSFAPLAGHRPSLAPTQTDPTLAIPAGAPSLTSVDLGFLDSLSSMFDSMQYAPPTSSTHVPAPSTSENAASSHPLDACAPTEASTFASLVADPPAWLRDGDQDQDAGLWQWCTAPDGELWSQWEAYIHDQGGVQDPDFLAS